MRVPASTVVGGFGWSPKAKAQAGDGVLLALRSRPDRAGDRYRYAWDVEIREKTPAGATVKRGREEALFEIVEVRSNGLLVARTRLTISGAGEDLHATANPYERAWTGVRVVFETDALGLPHRARNWPEARAQMLANFRREAPEPSQERAEVETFIRSAQADAPVQLLGADLTALAGARSGGPVPAGRRDLPPEPFEREDGEHVKLFHTVDHAWLDEDRARSERISRTSDGRQLIRSTATICTETGWPLVLEAVQAECVAEAGYEHVRISKARRLDDAA